MPVDRQQSATMPPINAIKDMGDDQRRRFECSSTKCDDGELSGWAMEVAAGYQKLSVWASR
jgi:hypothetical protein